jgi:hypothetical protein
MSREVRKDLGRCKTMNPWRLVTREVPRGLRDRSRRVRCSKSGHAKQLKFRTNHLRTSALYISESCWSAATAKSNAGVWSGNISADKFADVTTP